MGVSVVVQVNILEAEPYIDRSPKLNESEQTARLQARMPNLPLVYWYQNKNKQLGRNTSCAQYPGIYDIHFNNIYWQQVDTSNGTFFLYGAYLDVREGSMKEMTMRMDGMRMIDEDEKWGGGG